METVLAAPTKPPVVPHLQKQSYRIDSIDLLRGLVMIIMALDHTRDYFHDQAFTGDPLNMQTTTPLLYFTRWITHFCAPVFVFLAGTSGFLQSLRKSKAELSGFLIKRGLWLVFVEVIIMSFGITFDINFSNFFLQTIWAIGISMVFLGIFIWLPFPALFALGILIVFGHNALDYYEKDGQSFSAFYHLIHRQNFQGYPLWNGHNVSIVYPFLPWVGLMILGYCFGKLFTIAKERRKPVLAWLGFGTVLLFIVLRAINEYGDPNPWSEQKNGLFTFLSFLNTTKYPISLMFICMTIGPAILFLAFVGNTRSRFAKWITVYGRVPFLYYVLHFYLLHLITSIVFLARGHSFNEGLSIPGFPFKFVMPGEGYDLGIVYLVWIAVVIALYPVCKWFSEYKRTHKQWWLSYL